MVGCKEFIKDLQHQLVVFQISLSLLGYFSIYLHLFSSRIPALVLLIPNNVPVNKGRRETLSAPPCGDVQPSQHTEHL